MMAETVQHPSAPGQGPGEGLWEGSVSARPQCHLGWGLWVHDAFFLKVFSSFMFSE